MKKITSIIYNSQEYAALKGDTGIGLQGPQGETGLYDPDDPETPVFTLATTIGNDGTKCMTQKAVTEALYDESLWEWLSKGVPEQVKKTFINTSGVWKIDSTSSNKNSCYLTKVNPGDVLKLSKKDPANGSFSYGWLTSNTIPQTDTAASFADGATIPYWSADPIIVVAPEGASYLYVRKLSGSTTNDITPDIKVAIKTKDKIDMVHDIESRIVSLVRIDTTPYYNNQKYVNGGGIWADGSSTNRSKFIPVKPGRLYKVRCQTGISSYHAFFVKNNLITLGTQAEYAGGITVMPSWRADDQYLLAPADAAYLYCRQRSGSETSITPTVYECRLLEDVDKYTSERFLLQQARMVKMTSQTTSGTISYNLTPALCLLHASDLHGDGDARNEVLKALERYGDLIDDGLMTGDVVDYYADGSDDSTNYPNGVTWWQASGLPEQMLFTLGNHDGAKKSTAGYDVVDGSASWDSKGQAWDYDNYFADYAQGLGYVFPEGYDDSESPYYKACYWYKDYPAQGIRLIGLDAIHRFDGVLVKNEGTWEIDTDHPGVKHLTDEQEQWLIARLNETLTGSGNAAAGYKVVIASHYPLDNFDGENTAWDDTTHKWVCNQNQTGGKVMVNGDKATNWHAILNPSITADKKFNWRNRVGTTSSWSAGTVNNVGNILEDFIAGGGEFVAWLCGHYHAQLMYYPTAFPNVLCIAVSQTGWRRADSTIYRNDLSRERACMNFIAIHESINTDDHRRDEHLIRIVRIGCKVDKALAPQNVLCYDWKKRKVISEW